MTRENFEIDESVIFKVGEDLWTLKQTQKRKQMEVCCQKIDKILKKKIEINSPRTRKR